MKKAIVLYWSRTGNTKKVAHVIEEGLSEAGLDVSLKKIDEAEELDYFDYDLVCMGFPSYEWHVPKPVSDFLKKKLNVHRKQGKVKYGSPKVPGKNALIFCTYSGPHTGIDEATPAGDYVGQFFGHIGFNVLDKWYVLSEFIGNEAASTEGRMGDIRGLPTKDDLNRIKEKAVKLAETL
jgi:flavodoxin